MSRRGFLSFLGPIFSFICLSFGAHAYEPACGSAERKAILDAIRPRIVAEMRGEVEFVVRHLQVDQEFAFAILDPQRPGGGAIALNDTVHAGSGNLMDGLTVYALMRARDDHWGVIVSVTGPTDVVYWGWWDEYDAPRQIFEVREAGDGISSGFDENRCER